MDHEKFRNVLGGLQSLVLSIAIVVGGLWTLYTYGPEYQKIQKELKERRAIVINMEPAQVSIPGDPGRYIAARVRFENVGNKTELIYWPAQPFSASRVWIDDRGSFQVEQLRGMRVEAPAGSETGLRLMPRIVVNRIFLARVDKPGLYYLELDVEASPEEHREAQDEGVLARVTWKEVAQIVDK
jgi:hypothetical protein